MNRILKKTITIIPLVVLFFLGLIFLLTTLDSSHLFLSKTKKVKANLLVVEGWIPQYALEMAYKEFIDNKYDLIVTTGIKSTDLDYCTIASNGYLIFYPNLKSFRQKETNQHIIEVKAHAKMSGKFCAHFNFFVNDSLVDDFTADETEREYGITWMGSLKDIDSLMIQFDNDLWIESGDRNLYVKEIIIDNKIIIPYQYNSELDVDLLDGKERYTFNFNSNAELCRNRLLDYGIDSSLVIAVPSKRVIINRTLTTAVAFQNWLKSSDRKVTGINIISLGVHARRTWIIYRKVLYKSYDIGIISLSENEILKSYKPGLLEMGYEILGIIYYLIILPFVHI